MSWIYYRLSSWAPNLTRPHTFPLATRPISPMPCIEWGAAFIAAISPPAVASWRPILPRRRRVGAHVPHAGGKMDFSCGDGEMECALFQIKQSMRIPRNKEFPMRKSIKNPDSNK
ncbi:hypothetical protein PIB30_035807 [Stylosanthes scabra]|uniref:Uncharacterized protein n=1 Tax=Stylosanthes scabra TaxID=79078 RepID=A0ABU6WDF0_9FABA|nr:hypothetical protein [Stylosanthes scabra]